MLFIAYSNRNSAVGLYKVYSELCSPKWGNIASPRENYVWKGKANLSSFHPTDLFGLKYVSASFMGRAFF